MTRCKMKVEHIIQKEQGAEITAKPVTCGSKENEEFFKWTPYGCLHIGLVRPEIVDQFQPGTEFYVDLIPVEN